MPHEVLIEAAAAARLRRLIAIDRITEGPRDKFVKAVWQRAYDKDRTDEPALIYLLRCPFCGTIWTAIIIHAMNRGWGRHIVRVLAASYLAGQAEHATK